MSEHDLLVTNMLKNSKSVQGHSLYEHLSVLLDQVPLTKKLNNLEHFQTLSAFLKINKPAFKQPLTHEQVKHLESHHHKAKNHSIVDVSELRESAKKLKNLQKTLINNFQSQSNLFEWAGISFNKQQSLNIHLSIKRLAAENNAKRIRFWGKILTRTSDYYVAQGIAYNQDHTELLEGMEKIGEGVNYYTYWVTHDYLKEWTALPLITSQHIQASRKIKHILTGNLSAQVRSYPIFMGLQKHFLKAQLVRITHACEISPKGLYTTLEDNAEEVDFTEQFKMPQFNELTNLQNWAHLNQYILQQGRCSYFIDPNLPQQIRQQISTELNEKDPKIERLKGINEDKPVEGYESSWIARLYGDTQVFNGKQEGTSTCYAVVGLKNLNWPGWITVANNKIHSSIYIGYGIKSQQPLFNPIGPDDLGQEGIENDQFGEPNPTEPPDELEPDSDDQNKKVEQE